MQQAVTAAKDSGVVAGGELDFDCRLGIAAQLTSALRLRVAQELEFTVSAGAPPPQSCLLRLQCSAFVVVTEGSRLPLLQQQETMTENRRTLHQSVISNQAQPLSSQNRGLHNCDDRALLAAGISHNKLVAKLASAMNKPNNQTIVPYRAVPGIMATLPMKKIRNFGGKVGQALEQLGCKMAADVQAVPMDTLVAKFGSQQRAECGPGHLLQAPCSLFRLLTHLASFTWLLPVAGGWHVLQGASVMRPSPSRMFPRACWQPSHSLPRPAGRTCSAGCVCCAKS